MAFLSARAAEFKAGGLFVMAYISRSERDQLSTHSANSSTESSPNPGVSAMPTGLHRGVTLSGALGSSKQSDSLPATPADGHGPVSSANVATMPERPEHHERSTSSPILSGSARKRDIWDVLSGLLGKAIQPLVSTQLLKPAIARQLLGERRRLKMRDVELSLASFVGSLC